MASRYYHFTIFVCQKQLFGFSVSRLLGFSASRLLGFSASQLLSFPASRLPSFSASRLLSFSASRLLSFSASWLLGFSASRLLGFLASWLLPLSASRLLGFSACACGKSGLAESRPDVRLRPGSGHRKVTRPGYGNPARLQLAPGSNEPWQKKIQLSKTGFLFPQ